MQKREGAGVSPSPLPPSVQRNIGDKLYERRKGAALEVERIVGAAHSLEAVTPIVDALVEYTRSANTNCRKGGLLCLAATAVGLAGAGEGDGQPDGASLPPELLSKLLAPVLDALTDPDSRTRFYALEALYNIMRASRASGSLAPEFPQVLAALFAVYGDSSPDVQNAAAVLDNLLKDLFAEAVHSLDGVIPLLQDWLDVANAVKQSFVLGWLGFLDNLPDSELELGRHLPELLPGLLRLLGRSEQHPEIRQGVQKLLHEFLLEAHTSPHVDLPQLASILVSALSAPEQQQDDTTTLTCLRWLRELLQRGSAQLLPQFAPILAAVLPQRGSANPVIASAATQLLQGMRQQLEDREESSAAGEGGGAPAEQLNTHAVLEVVSGCLEGATEEEVVKLEALQWLQLLLLQRSDAAEVCSADGTLLTALFDALHSVSERVVKECLEVVARVAARDGAAFTAVMRATLSAFRGGGGARLLQRQGSHIIQHFCECLGAKQVFAELSRLLGEECDPSFLLSIVQALNLILMTAAPLHGLRKQLRLRQQGLFAALWGSWSASTAAALALSLLAQEDELACELLQTISSQEPSLQDTLELTQLVALLEAPAFASLRMRLLAPAEHPHLLRAIAGLLQLLPQGEAFRTLQARLAVVPHLQLPPAPLANGHAADAAGRGDQVAHYSSVFRQRHS